MCAVYLYDSLKTGIHANGVYREAFQLYCIQESPVKELHCYTVYNCKCELYFFAFWGTEEDRCKNGEVNAPKTLNEKELRSIFPNANIVYKHRFTDIDVSIVDGKLKIAETACVVYTFDSYMAMRKKSDCIPKTGELNGKTYTIAICNNQVTPEINFLANAGINSTGWINVSGFNEKKDCDTVNVRPPWMGKDIPYATRMRFFEATYSEMSLSQSYDPKYENYIPKSIKMAFDIESYNPNPGITIRDDKKCTVLFQISCAIRCDNDVHKVLFTLGKPEGIDEDVAVYKCEDYIEILLRFADFIRYIKPTLITGWNIFGFDLAYMHYKIEDVGYNHSASVGRPEPFKDVFFKRLSYHPFSRGWSKPVIVDGVFDKASNVSAYTFITPGTYFACSMEILKKEFAKLESYSLGFVAQQLLGSTKDDVSNADMVKCYSDCFIKRTPDWKMLGKVGQYCVKDSALSLGIFEHKLYGPQIDTQACINHLPPSQMVSRNQSIRVLATVYHSCIANNMVFHESMCVSRDYEGALVLNPKLGIHKTVISFDFASLYPSVMKCFNICPSTRVTKMPNGDIQEELKPFCNSIRVQSHVNCIHDPRVVMRTYNNVLANVKKQFAEAVSSFTLRFKAPRSAQIKDTTVENTVISECNSIKSSIGYVLRRLRSIYVYDDENRVKSKELKDISEMNLFSGLHFTFQIDGVEELNKKITSLQEYILDRKLNDAEMKKLGQILIAATKLDFNEYKFDSDEAEQSKANPVCVDTYEYFLKKEYRNGIFPQHAENCNVKRREARKAMEGCSDTSKKALLDQIQLGYKICANSTYGIAGTKKSPLYHVHTAEAITTQGRAFLRMSSELLQRYRCNIIYGDTDSQYLNVPHILQETGVAFAAKQLPLNGIEYEQACALATDRYAKETLEPAIKNEFAKYEGISLENEGNVFSRILWLSKKRYLSKTIMKGGKFCSVMPFKGKGTMLQRRDSAIIERIGMTFLCQAALSINTDHQLLLEELKTCLGEEYNDLLNIFKDLLHNDIQTAAIQAVYMYIGNQIDLRDLKLFSYIKKSKLTMASLTSFAAPVAEGEKLVYEISGYKVKIPKHVKPTVDVLVDSLPAHARAHYKLMSSGENVIDGRVTYVYILDRRSSKKGDCMTPVQLVGDGQIYVESYCDKIGNCFIEFLNSSSHGLRGKSEIVNHCKEFLEYSFFQKKLKTKIPLFIHALSVFGSMVYNPHTEIKKIINYAKSRCLLIADDDIKNFILSVIQRTIDTHKNTLQSVYECYIQFTFAKLVSYMTSVTRVLVMENCIYAYTVPPSGKRSKVHHKKMIPIEQATTDCISLDAYSYGEELSGEFQEILTHCKTGNFYDQFLNKRIAQFCTSCKQCPENTKTDTTPKKARMTKSILTTTAKTCMKRM